MSDVITGKIIELKKDINHHYYGQINTAKGILKFKIQDDVGPIFKNSIYRFTGEIGKRNTIIVNSADIAKDISEDDLIRYFNIVNVDKQALLEKFGVASLTQISNKISMISDDELNNMMLTESEKRFVEDIISFNENPQIRELYDVLSMAGKTFDIDTATVLYYKLRRRVEIYNRNNGTSHTVAEIVKLYPYTLMQTDVFDSRREAKKIAEGIDSDNTFYSAKINSMAAGVVYQYCNNTGDSYMPYNKFIGHMLSNTGAVKMSNQEKKLMANHIYNSVTGNEDKIRGLTGYVVLDKKYSELINKNENNENADTAVYIPKVFFAERYVADTIKKMLYSPMATLPNDFYQQSMNTAKNMNIVLDPLQQEAIKAIKDNIITVITGSAGTGKTALIKIIAKTLKDMGEFPVILAPTGIAAERAAKDTGVDYQTIHRYAKIYFGEDEILSVLEQNNNDSENTLHERTIIVDEMSMMTMPVMAKLMSVCENAKRLIFVGDPNQLPPVGPGGVFENLIRVAKENLPNICHIQLEQIHRNSPIISAANSLLLNNMLDTIINDYIYYYETNSWENIYKQIKEILSSIKDSYGPNALINDTMVLASKKSHVEFLNQKIRSDFYIKDDTNVFTKGDLIINTRNDYSTQDNFLRDKIRYRAERPTIYNGATGVIVKLPDEDDDKYWVKFTNLNEPVPYNAVEISWYLTYRYAISIHKAQGGQARFIIIANNAPEKISKNMLYTAITRCRDGYVYFIGGKKDEWGAIREPINIHTKLYYRIMDVEIAKSTDQRRYINIIG